MNADTDEPAEQGARSRTILSNFSDVIDDQPIGEQSAENFPSSEARASFTIIGLSARVIKPITILKMDIADNFTRPNVAAAYPPPPNPVKRSE